MIHNRVKNLRKIKIWISVTLTILFLVPITYSVSLGSLIKKDSATIEAGDRVNFEILFWNLEESYNLKINEKDVPSNWRVLIEPDDFTLDNSGNQKPPYDEGEYINLPGIGTIKPEKVEVEIVTSEITEIGDYIVSLVAITSGSEEDISVFQERDINFKISVLGGEDNELEEELEEEILEEEPEFTEEDLIGESNDVYELSEEENTKEGEEEVKNSQEEGGNPLTGQIVRGLSSTLSSQSLIILLGIIFTVLGCVVIYKYV
jgi:hypothetical protein